MHGPTSIVWANLRPLSLQSLFHFPHQNEWQNHSTTDAAGHYMHGVWAAWGYEEPFVYFDKRMKRWRALFHQYRKAGLLGRGGAGTWPVAGKAVGAGHDGALRRRFARVKGCISFKLFSGRSLNPMANAL